MTNPDIGPASQQSQPQAPQEEVQWTKLPPISEIPVGGSSRTEIKDDRVDHAVYGAQGELIGQKATDREGNEKPVGGTWVDLPPLDTLTPANQMPQSGLIHRLGSIIKSSRQK